MKISREKLIALSVKNLKQFGYPSINDQNIFTTMIYKKFFLRQLEDYLEDESLSLDTIEIIEQLIKELR